MPDPFGNVPSFRTHRPSRGFGLMGVGFTGFGCLFAVVFIGIFSLVFGTLFAGCIDNFIMADTQRQHAESEAHVWIQDMYSEQTGEHVVCQAQDTDGNGYVTCSARLNDDTHLNLECYAWVWMNPGDNTCREIIPVRGYQTR